MQPVGRREEAGRGSLFCVWSEESVNVRLKLTGIDCIRSYKSAGWSELPIFLHIRFAFVQYTRTFAAVFTNKYEE